MVSLLGRSASAHLWDTNLILEHFPDDRPPHPCSVLYPSHRRRRSIAEQLHARCSDDPSAGTLQRHVAYAQGRYVSVMLSYTNLILSLGC